MPARILIIEDDELLQDLLAMHLEVEGYVVFTAPNGRAALELLERQPADLILLDLMMPVMDGFRFMTALSARAAPPVVVLSAAGIGDRERQARAQGAAAVVRKPIESEALVDCIRSILGTER